MQVDVTQKGDVILDINLPKVLPVPLKLRLEYTNLDDRVQRRNDTTKNIFINSKEILHREVASRVPYQNFGVSVRLISDDKEGPLVDSMEDYGKQNSFNYVVLAC